MAKKKCRQFSEGVKIAKRPLASLFEDKTVMSSLLAPTHVAKSCKNVGTTQNVFPWNISLCATMRGPRESHVS